MYYYAIFLFLNKRLNVEYHFMNKPQMFVLGPLECLFVSNQNVYNLKEKTN